MADPLITNWEKTQKNLLSGRAERINIVTRFNEVTPQLAKYLATFEDLKLNGGISVGKWLEHNDTAQLGVTNAVRTSNATTRVTFNNQGTLQTLTVADIDIPLTNKDEVMTTILCFPPNNVRLFGNFNGIESEAIVVEVGSKVTLVSDLSRQTHQIVEKASTASTTFTAEIYDPGTDTPVATSFSAEIYEAIDNTPFTANIYEDS